jgi:hypothetical protein
MADDKKADEKKSDDKRADAVADKKASEAKAGDKAEGKSQDKVDSGAVASPAKPDDADHTEPDWVSALKDWVRHEIALNASGVSEGLRRQKNP